MRVGRLGMVVAAGIVILGCKSKIPTLPTRNVPAGVVMFHFTRKAKGPVDLVLDGVRIPVSQKVKDGGHLVIKGLQAGKHKYFISGSRDAFGPDQGEFEVAGSKGVYLVLFSINFEAALYGKQEPAPAAEGLPGVQASLEK